MKEADMVTQTRPTPAQHDAEQMEMLMRLAGMQSPTAEESRLTNTTKYQNIPNPGVTKRQHLSATALGGTLTWVIAGLVVDWPTTVLPLVNYWGPLLMMGLVSTAVYVTLIIKKDPFELAIMEYADLGLRPEVIGSVIVENRAKAFTLINYRDDITDPTCKGLVSSIVTETFDIIHGFRDDPSDANRSRSTLTRCLDQAIKIMDNYSMIERRKDTLGEDFDELYALTTGGLEQIRDALVEQHRRNLDNNTSALEIDLEVSSQLLNKFKS